MAEEKNEEEKISILSKIKEIPNKLKEKIKLPKRKKKDILHKFLEERREKEEPKIKQIYSRIVERSKQTPESVKNSFRSLASGTKQKIFNIRDSITNTKESMSQIPGSVKEKTSSVKNSFNNFVSFSIEGAKSYFRKKRKEIEESPPFIQKHLVSIKPIEKSMMVTAKKSAVFYWVKEEINKIDKNVPVEFIDTDHRIKKLKEEILDSLDYGSVTEILVKCIELARLEGAHNEIEWMESELNGYSTDKTFVTVKSDNFPEYRRVKAILPVSWYIKGKYSLTNEDLEIPFYCVKPINWIEEIISRCKKKSTREIKTEIPVPKELKIVKKYFKDDKITIITPIPSLEAVLSGVKIRTQEFLLDLGAKKMGKKRKRKRKKH